MVRNIAKDTVNFMKKASLANDTFVESFESVGTINVPAISIPLTIELSEQEKLAIKKIIIDDYQLGTISENQVAQHVDKLTNITKQIKAISTQSVLLHGERIKQAQELLSNYHEGAFSKWLMITYGNRQSPYNMLRYYEFYQSAPQTARPMIEGAPKKCVYILASREGNDQTKLDLLQNHGNKPQIKFLKEIQQAFPTQENIKRKPQLTSTIESISKLCSKLEDSSKHLSDNDRSDLKKIILRLQKL